MSVRHAALGAAFTPPGPSSVDLHSHTTRSDGILEPPVLAAAAAAAGVRTMSITDHDTLAGYRELIRDALVPPTLELIPGVEINAVAPDRVGSSEGELHVIGLGVDPDDEAFEGALVRQREARRIRFWATVDRCREIGLPIDAEVGRLQLTDETALGRPTVARALVAAGHAISVDDAFVRLIGRGCPAYVPRSGLDTIAAIDAIRGAGGLPVLAHFREAPSLIDTLRELRDRGLRGLEVYYRSFDPPTVEAVGAVAETLALVPSGGSDYHGDSMTYAESHAGLWVPPLVADRVREAIAARARTRGVR